jgi:hypothetical protein
MTETSDVEPVAGDASPAAWHRILCKAGLVYLYSRICVLAGAAIVAAELRGDANATKGLGLPFADPALNGHPLPNSALRPIIDVFSSWDGLWYLRIVRFGYPRHVQAHVTYNVLDARAAFFPVFPMLVRAFNKVMPGGDTVSALFINFVLGAVAVFLVGVMARRLYNDQVAAKAMVLAAVFPGSFVLSFVYSEALLLVLAMGCLLCLMSQRWVAAGVLAALGTATRPNGLALVLACAVAAVIAIRQHRDWKALLAPAIAPAGFVAFQLWLGHHANEAGVWFGLTALRKTFNAFASPLTSPTNIVTAASVVATAMLIYFLWRRRLPLPAVAYCAGILFLMVLPSTVTARPRFLYTALPLFISAAAYRHEDRRDWWPYIIGACSAGLVTLTALYGVFGAIP